MRVSGKHNDLDNVGPSHRHHTFFEMLGNFSLRRLLQDRRHPLRLGAGAPRDVVRHRSGQAAASPSSTASGIPATTRPTNSGAAFEAAGRPHPTSSGGKDNFWQMGDTGPCGPCSEITTIWVRRPSGEAAPTASSAASAAIRRDLEPGLHAVRPPARWRHCGLLPKPSIDTGSGLERITAVLQGMISNFHTDLFTPLIERGGDRACARRPSSPRCSYPGEKFLAASLQCHC